MAKTQEELNRLRKEYMDLKNKLKELTDDELKKVTGGQEIFVPEIDAPITPVPDPIINKKYYQ